MTTIADSAEVLNEHLSKATLMEIAQNDFNDPAVRMAASLAFDFLGSATSFARHSQLMLRLCR